MNRTRPYEVCIVINLLRKLAVVIVLLSPMAANADIIRGELRTTIKDSFDTFGIFGKISDDPNEYTGMPVRITWAYDTALAPSDNRPDDPTRSEYESTTPVNWIFDLAVTLNGITFNGFGLPLPGATQSLGIGANRPQSSNDTIGFRSDLPERGPYGLDTWFIVNASLDKGSLGSDGLPQMIDRSTVISAYAVFGFQEVVECIPDGPCIFGRKTLMRTTFDSTYFSLTPVPEPSTITLFGIGLLGLGWARGRYNAR